MRNFRTLREHLWDTVGNFTLIYLYFENRRGELYVQVQTPPIDLISSFVALCNFSIKLFSLEIFAEPFISIVYIQLCTVLFVILFIATYTIHFISGGENWTENTITHRMETKFNYSKPIDEKLFSSAILSHIHVSVRILIKWNEKYLNMTCIVPHSGASHEDQTIFG